MAEELSQKEKLNGKGDEKLPQTTSVPQNVQLDVVSLLKQVLQWTPLYKPSLNLALLQAAKIGSVGCVKVLLSTGIDVDGEDENGDTAFVHAFLKRHVDVMKLLHAAGCQTEIAKMSVALATKDAAFIRLCKDLDIPIENEDWALSDIEGVRILVEDLQIDAYKSSYGNHSFDESPFMYLAQEGKPEVLEYLANAGRRALFPYYSDAEFDNFLNLALHRAAKFGRLDNVKVLLACGANLSSSDKQGRSVFLVACGHSESVALYLIQLGVSVTGEDEEGLSALHWAACAGYEQLCRSLIQKGAPLNRQAKHGVTPLMVACSMRYDVIVRIFLSAGASISVATQDGWTALHVAVRGAAHSIVKSLLRHGANPDVASTKLTQNYDIVPGSTPLLIAVALNSVRMVNYLVDANCDINLCGLVCIDLNMRRIDMELNDEESKDRMKRCSPLQFAFISHAWDVAELLIKLGCNTDEASAWLDATSSTSLPQSHRSTLATLITQVSRTPRSLAHLARACIRQRLGYGLVAKLNQLHVASQQHRFLLFHDVFAHALGSFDV